VNATLLVSTDEPFAIISMVNAPDASGSGKSLTPFSRMHSENFTAFSRVVAAPLLPLLPVPALPVPPQPALIKATMATVARVAVLR
jgi:hypothetical protein